MTPSEEYRLIRLTKGQFAKVSHHRFEGLSGFKWRAWWNKHTRSFYAVRHKGMVKGKTGTIYTHRQILGLEKGDPRTGDHENHDTLDNQDHNLRVANRHEQQGNKRKYHSNKSGFKGIYPQGKRWKATIGSPSGTVYLGVRDTPEAAYFELYVPAAKAYFGSFAHFDHKNPPNPIEALPLREL